MTLLHHQGAPANQEDVPAHNGGPDAEALIRKARRLRRRRWALSFLMVVLVAGGAVVGLVSGGGRARPAHRAPLRFHAGGPTVDARAFAGEGDLAFVSRHTAYVLDGATNTLRRLVLPGKADG